MANSVNLVTIEAPELSAYTKRFAAAGKEIAKDVTVEFERYGQVLDASLAGEVPYRTGKLADSVKVKIVNKNRPNVRLEVNVGSAERPEVVVRSILFGSKPHEIVPKRKGGVLVFASPGESFRPGGKGRGDAGGLVFRKRVWHPGTKPNNFLRRAWDKTENVREAMGERILGGIIAHLIGKE